MATVRDYWSDTLKWEFGHRDRRSGKLVPVETVLRQYLSSALYNTSRSNHFVGTYKRTIDRVNSYYRNLRDGTIKNTGVGIWFDMGGPFWGETVKVTLPTPLPSLRWPLTGTNWKTLEGPDYPSLDAYTASQNMSRDSLNYAGNVGLSYGEMLTYGTTGISRALPSLPAISLFQILGELREGLPSLPGRTLVSGVKQIAKGSKKRKKGFDPGGEYLNLAFGIMPSVQSILDLAEISRNYPILREKMVARHGGRIRRKRIVLDTSTRTYVTGVERSYPCLIYGSYSKEVVTERKVWVESVFSQAAAVSALDARIAGLSELDALLGLTPNAANIWELVPWSWLIDWFSNTGEVFKNLSYCGVNGLRLLHAYVMCETHTTTTWTWQGPHPAYGALPLLQQVIEVTTKQRLRASPYIFGLTFSELTVFQKAVLAALGWSRVRR